MRRMALLISLMFSLSLFAAEGEKHALLIGVQQYSDKEQELGNLLYAENDVRELAVLLKQQGYPEGNIHLLTVSNAFDTRADNLRPTAKNILVWLNYVCKNTQPQDTLLVAFAGHGVELKDKTGAFRPFFCPLEASLDDEKTLVSVSDVYNDLEKKCKARVKLLVMDACRKSRVGRDASLTRPLIPDPPGGIVAFFSCGKGQKAYESDTFKHGVFFHYFIAGLKGAAAGADGEVTVPLLEHYLTRQVPRAVVQEQKDPQAEQYPERRGQLLGEVVLAKFAAPKPPEPSAPSASPAAGNGKVLTLDLGKGVKMELLRIPKGTFTMGDKDDGPAHEVTISRDYFMGKYHVTQEQYEAVMGTNPSHFKGDQNPVEKVSWDDAVVFCAKLSQLTGKRVELPTEAQWERACRAGTTTAYYTGDSEADLARAGWYGENSGTKTHPVGQKTANFYGLFDMHGNVLQWCQDRYEEYYGGAQTDPTGPKTGAAHVLRGGSWVYSPEYCRSAERYNFPPVLRNYGTGFRVVVSGLD